MFVVIQKQLPYWELSELAAGILLSEDGDVFEDDRREWFVASVAGHAGDGFDDIESFEDFSEHGVVVIEVRCWHFGDEELRTVGIGAGVCHGEDAGHVMSEFSVEFILELVARSADADAERAAALDHEIGDDTVEDDAIIERSFFLFMCFGVDEFNLAGGKSNKIFDSVGDEIFI